MFCSPQFKLSYYALRFHRIHTSLWTKSTKETKGGQQSRKACCIGNIISWRPAIWWLHFALLIIRFMLRFQLQQKDGSGVLALLYSCMLTRGPDRIKSDLQDHLGNCLIDPMGDCTQPLLNLVVIGKCTPYLHNGQMIVDEDSAVSLCSYSLTTIYGYASPAV